MPPLPVFRTKADLRQQVTAWRQDGQKIALVPTMGALHAGHLDLIRIAQSKADRVIASIFVNPTQFAPHEDLDRYPRQEAADRDALSTAGCDGLYAPTTHVMYPAGFDTSITPGRVAERLEGAFRPHFFGGVATVVTKLFLQALPDVAVFGEKDWQQLQVIKRMVIDLDLGVDIVAAPTRREADGLALSSRNAYLSDAERAAAPVLKQVLDDLALKVRDEPAQLAMHMEAGIKRILSAGFRAVDYLEVCHAETLSPWQAGDPARILVAAWLGQTRLIDNCGLD